MIDLFLTALKYSYTEPEIYTHSKTFTLMGVRVAYFKYDKSFDDSFILLFFSDGV